MRQHDAMRVVRTWCNAWATSTRYHHERIFPCLFDCTSSGGACDHAGHRIEDRMIHYAQCPMLFALVSAICQPCQTSDNPLERWAIMNCSMDSLLVVSCMFAGYHACKRHATAEHYGSETLTHDARVQMHMIFCDYFHTAAQEIGLHCIARSSFRRAVSSIPDM